MPSNADFLSADAKEIIEKSIIETVAPLGFEVVEVRYFKEYGNYNVTVYLWCESGVDLNACETAHNALSTALDRYEELFPDNYVLNVSSQGLDRPIVTDDDFRRALNTEIEAVYQDNGAKVKQHGTLLSYDAENFTLQTGGKTPKQVVITRNSTAKVQPYIRF